MTFTKDGYLTLNSEFKCNSIDVHILKPSTNLFLPLITIENAENRHFSFPSDLKQNSIYIKLQQTVHLGNGDIDN